MAKSYFQQLGEAIAYKYLESLILGILKTKKNLWDLLICSISFAVWQI